MENDGTYNLDIHFRMVAIFHHTTDLKEVCIECNPCGTWEATLDAKVWLWVTRCVAWYSPKEMPRRYVRYAYYGEHATRQTRICRSLILADWAKFVSKNLERHFPWHRWYSTWQRRNLSLMLGTSSGRTGKWIWRASCVLSWLMCLWILGWKATITHHTQVASYTFKEKEHWQMKLIVFPEILRSASCIFLARSEGQ